MSRQHLLALLVAMLLVPVMHGCRSTPETVHYRLDLDVDQVEQTESDRPALALEQLSVDAAYDETQIAYRSSPYKLERYYYHRWAAPPGLLLTDAMREAYSATGRFRSVTSGSVARSDMVLSGQVVALEEIDVTDEEWQGRIVLELRLRDAVTGDLLWSETIEKRRDLDDRSPAGLAAALSESIGDVVEETSAEFVEVYRRRIAD
ncbi:MAG: ABC-type transport auxiliary lipoprotein family protein [Persicimonas sp.]